jgi:hydroxymethylglutaryl-CoA synthase
MAGIVSAAAYIPFLKMERKIMASAWGRRALPGFRSLANNDEDSLTMAAEAAAGCLGTLDREQVDGIYFASSTAPYREKQSSSLLATVLDLRSEVQAVDLGNSLRSGLSALRLALDAVAASSAASLLVAAGEQRLAYPKSDQEQMFGDAGAAALVVTEGEALTYLGGYCLSDDITDIWRTESDRYVNTWEARFVTSQGYLAVTAKAIAGLLAKLGLTAGDVSLAAIPAPDGRSFAALLKSTGLDGEGVALDPLLGEVGFCGAAQPLLLLASAMESAKPGDKILLAAYGDGAEALLFEVSGEVQKPTANIAGQLAGRKEFTSYARFLSYKDIVEPLPGEPFRISPSATVTWRERDSLLRCHGSRCLECGEVSYPIQRICNQCRSVDNFEHVRLSSQKGEVFTFSRDNLAGRPDDPVIVQTVAQMESGARFYGLMTDCDPDQVELGMPLKLTLRKLHELGGFHNYFWKCKPVR